MRNNIDQLFKKIAEKKVILFLGAGASVTDNKKYLSQQLIEYYRDLRNIDYEPEGNNIVDFVDKVFSLQEYDRNDFDYNVANWLRNNLKPEDYHSFTYTLPWLSIISTNIDLITEKIIEKDNLNEYFEIIRNLKELNQSLNYGDKCKVIKLHGCISDISKYKPLFSSADFESNNKYYNKVFSIIDGLSPDINILFIGYSFNDRFGNLFLNKFKERFKGREFYLVDPFLKDDSFNLKYFESNNIIPIKTYYKDFIEEYKDWYKKNSSKIEKSNNNLFFDTKGLSINRNFQEKIRPFIIPLNNTYNNEAIDAKNYYLGKEPNYSVIKYNFDVIKEKKINEVKQKIIDLFNQTVSSYPFVFLSGSYGTGKSTFAYRLIRKMIEDDSDLLAFEVIDLEKLIISDISELINKLTSTKKIIFYTEHSEQDLNFKKLRELRGHLSSMQFEDKSIILLQSIRENHLANFKKRLKPQIEEIEIDCEFSANELNILIDKLYHNKLINYRGEKEKQDLIKKINDELKINDQLLISLFLIENGSHTKHIIDTYNKFEYNSTKKAFLFTCLLYQYSIKMPLSLIRSIIGKDWNDFINEVIKVDGKGIFIQEKIAPDYYLAPDLYFKVKHTIIAEAFIKEKVKPNDLYKHYITLVQNLPENEVSIYVFINLIKRLYNDKIFDDSKINHLYDLAYNKLSNFIRFVIYYSRNLEVRRTKKDLKKALDILTEAEYQNYDIRGRDKFIIHRKASINYKLAKEYFEDNIELAKEYLQEAFELFEIKETIDPASIFSYKDYIALLLWYLNKWNLKEQEKIKIELKIHNLLNKGIDNVQDGFTQLLNLRENIGSRLNKNDTRERIDKLLDDYETRPLALLLKYELLMLEEITNDNEIEKQNLIEEIENYSYNDEVSLFLFHYYGNRLQYYDERLKYFKLLSQNRTLEEKEELNYLYYSFVAEIYNYKSDIAFGHQKAIRAKYKNSIVKKPIFWKEQDSDDDKIFNAKIILNNRGFYDLKILDSTGRLNAKIDNRSKGIVKDKLCKAKLFFTYTGIWGNIIEDS